MRTPKPAIILSTPTQAKPKLLDEVRAVARMKHFSLRTEEAYAGWIKRYILFHHKRHPVEMGEEEIRQFISHLARGRKYFCLDSNGGAEFAVVSLSRSP